MLHNMGDSVQGEEREDPMGDIRKAIEQAIADEAYLDEVAAPIADSYLDKQFKADVDTGTCPYCGKPSECAHHGCCLDCHPVHFVDNINSPIEMAKYISANIVMALYTGATREAVAGALAILKVEEFYEGWKEWAEQKIRGEDPPFPFEEGFFS